MQLHPRVDIVTIVMKIIGHIIQTCTRINVSHAIIPIIMKTF